jgi:hypothetical protein
MRAPPEINPNKADPAFASTASQCEICALYAPLTGHITSTPVEFHILLVNQKL